MVRRGPAPVEPGRVPRNGRPQLEAVRRLREFALRARLRVEGRLDGQHVVFHFEDWTAKQPEFKLAVDNGPGWTVAPGSADYAESSAPPADDRLVVATQNCQRVEGRLDGQHVVFHFEDWTAKQPEFKIAVDGSTVATEDANGGVLETTSIPQPETEGRRRAPVPTFALVVGAHAAALVVNGQIVGAVEVPARTKITVEPTASPVSMTNLRVGAPPIGSGCS